MFRSVAVMTMAFALICADGAGSELLAGVAGKTYNVTVIADDLQEPPFSAVLDFAVGGGFTYTESLFPNFPATGTWTQVDLLIFSFWQVDLPEFPVTTFRGIQFLPFIAGEITTSDTNDTFRIVGFQE